METDSSPNTMYNGMQSRQCPWCPMFFERLWVTDKLLVGTMIGVVLGLGLGLALVPTEMSKWVNQLIGIPGDLFLRALKLLVLPLVCGSITGGVLNIRRTSGGGDGTKVTKLMKRAILIYTITYVMALVIGLMLVLIIQPGKIDASVADTNSTRWQCDNFNKTPALQISDDTTILDTFLSVLHNAIPTNVFQAAADGNILGLIVCSMTVAFLLPVSSGVQPLTTPERVVKSFNEMIDLIVKGILAYSPIGILSLICGKITAACDVGDMFASLSKFIGTVTAGLLLHLFVSLPLVYFIITRKNPIIIYKTFFKAGMTALAISSSAATLPVTIECAREGGVPKDLADFVLVLGATVNMDGTAMYEAVSVLFIAQLHDHHLSGIEVIVVCLTSSFAAMGAAAIPSAGLVTMVMVLNAVNMGQYSDSIALILVVDWLLDRLRTAVNVIGDGAAVLMMDSMFPQDSQQPDIEMVGYDSPLNPEHVTGYLPGDAVAIKTVNGWIYRCFIKSIESSESFTITLPSGGSLCGWHPDWITVDPVQLRSEKQLEPQEHSLLT